MAAANGEKAAAAAWIEGCGGGGGGGGGSGDDGDSEVVGDGAMIPFGGIVGGLRRPAPLTGIAPGGGERRRRCPFVSRGGIGGWPGARLLIAASSSSRETLTMNEPAGLDLPLSWIRQWSLFAAKWVNWRPADDGSTAAAVAAATTAADRRRRRRMSADEPRTNEHWRRLCSGCLAVRQCSADI